MGTNGAVRRITTQDAKIKTATVELKALVIDGKQVTLSVFRQFQNEDLIDLESGQLKGVPWGRVNYYWGSCITAADHLHVVWQKGSELRRACVNRYVLAPSKLLMKEIDARLFFLAQCVLDGRITELAKEHDSLLCREKKLKPLLSSCLASQASLQCEMQYQARLKQDRPRTHDFLKRLEENVKLIEGNMERHREELREYTREHPYEEGSIEHAQRLIAEFENNWSESYTAVASTEQLFIAV